MDGVGSVVSDYLEHRPKYLSHCGRSLKFSESLDRTLLAAFYLFNSPLASLIKPARFRKKGDLDLGEEAVWFMAAGMIWHGVSAAPAYSQDGTISKSGEHRPPGQYAKS